MRDINKFALLTICVFLSLPPLVSADLPFDPDLFPQHNPAGTYELYVDNLASNVTEDGTAEHPFHLLDSALSLANAYPGNKIYIYVLESPKAYYISPNNSQLTDGIVIYGKQLTDPIRRAEYHKPKIVLMTSPGLSLNDWCQITCCDFLTSEPNATGISVQSKLRVDIVDSIFRTGTYYFTNATDIHISEPFDVGIRFDYSFGTLANLLIYEALSNGLIMNGAYLYNGRYLISNCFNLTIDGIGNSLSPGYGIILSNYAHVFLTNNNVTNCTGGGIGWPERTHFQGNDLFNNNSWNNNGKDYFETSRGIARPVAGSNISCDPHYGPDIFGRLSHLLHFDGPGCSLVNEGNLLFSMLFPYLTTSPDGAPDDDLPDIGFHHTCFLPETPWRQYLFNNRHTGRSPYNFSDTEPSKIWEAQLAGLIMSQPVLDGENSSYIGSFGNQITAVDPQGNIKWTFQTDDDNYATGVLGPDRGYYFPSLDHKFYALDSSGNFRWSFTSGGSHYSSPCISEDHLLMFGSNDGNLYTFQLKEDGGQHFAWSYPVGSEVWSAPAIGSDRTIYVGATGQLLALEPNGVLKWTAALGDASYQPSAPVVGMDERIYFWDQFQGIRCFNPDGQQEWFFPISSSDILGAPVLAKDGTLYAHARTGTLYAINSNGSLRWNASTDADVFCSPMVDDNGRIMVGGIGRVLAFNENGTQLWSVDVSGAGAFHGSPVLGSDGILRIGAENGKLYALAVPTVAPTDTPVPPTPTNTPTIPPIFDTPTPTSTFTPIPTSTPTPTPTYTPTPTPARRHCWPCFSWPISFHNHDAQQQLDRKLYRIRDELLQQSPAGQFVIPFTYHFADEFWTILEQDQLLTLQMAVILEQVMELSQRYFDDELSPETIIITPQFKLELVMLLENLYPKASSDLKKEIAVVPELLELWEGKTVEELEEIWLPQELWRYAGEPVEIQKD